MDDLAVYTEGLSKSYGTFAAVSGLSVKVPRGAVYGFLGRNGAGKTTTMKMLLGLIRPDAGTARVLGLDPQRERIRMLERVGFVSESKALYGSLTAAEMVKFVQPFYPKFNEEGAREYGNKLDVPWDRPWGKLSHGNRTKVYLLLALAQGAELLVLDEPTSGLDPVTVDELLKVLRKDHLGAGGTIFFSSHHLEEVDQFADWVGIIDNGKLLLEARMDEIRAGFRCVTVSVSRECIADLQPNSLVSCCKENGVSKLILSRGADDFAAKLRQQGADVQDISPITLRELFLQLLRKDENVLVEMLARH
jgi:ABC-2 type transport system ATP-binding protein